MNLAAQDPRLVEGLRLINEGRFWDAHEVLEDLWMAKAGEDKLFVQALIQADVGLYHRDNGNFTGAEKLFAHAGVKLAKLRTASFAGIAVNDLTTQIAALLEEARAINSGRALAANPKLRLILPVNPSLPRPRYTIDEQGEVHFADPV